MPSGRALLTFGAAALLELLPLVVAQIEDTHGSGGKTVIQAPPSRPTVPDGVDEATMEPQSYFALSDHSSVIFAHISVMVLAWAVVLPVGRSRVKATIKNWIS